MNTLRTILASAGLVLLCTASASAQQVKTDYDRKADFAQYKTYSWEKVHTQNPLLVDRIKSAVNANLDAKGWRQVDSGGDIAIVAMATSQTRQTLNTFYDGFGGGWRWRGFGGFGQATTTVDTYKVGTLVVDLFDGRSKQLVWRGSASDTVSHKSEKNIEHLNKGVEKLFSHFPPNEK